MNFGVQAQVRGARKGQSVSQSGYSGTGFPRKEKGREAGGCVFLLIMGGEV